MLSKDFAFVIHPLDMADVIRYEPSSTNKREELVMKILEWTPAYKVSDIVGVTSSTGRSVEGAFIAANFLPRQFVALPREKVYKKIVDAGKIAEKLGAKIVGLGGFTSVVGDAGVTVAKHLKIAVTSGNSYTIATALEGALEGARIMGIEAGKAHACVVGATGSIGRVCSALLARQVSCLTMVARHLTRLKRVAEEVSRLSGRSLNVSTDVAEALRTADVVISASSSGGGIIQPGMLKPGAVVCDVALPHDVSREVAEVRKDVLVIEGGLVEVPGERVSFNFNFGYPEKIALACMSETMILALERRYENFSLGRKIEISKVMEISDLARKHGFKLAGFRSFDRPVTLEDIESIKENVKQSLSRKRISFA